MSDKTADPFLVKAQQRLETLVREEAALAAQEDGVHKRRLEKQAEAAIVKRVIAIYHELMDVETVTSPGQITAALEPNATVADLIFGWLQAHGNRGRVKEILRGLVQVGKFVDESNSNYSIVYTALMRDSRFEKVGRGEFGLKAPAVTHPGIVTPGEVTALAQQDDFDWIGGGESEGVATTR